MVGDAHPTGVTGIMHWVKVAEPVVVTRGLSPLLPNDQVTVIVISFDPAN